MKVPPPISLNYAILGRNKLVYVNMRVPSELWGRRNAGLRETQPRWALQERVMPDGTFGVSWDELFEIGLTASYSSQAALVRR